jgi:hypothetical protein
MPVFGDNRGSSAQGSENPSEKLVNILETIGQGSALIQFTDENDRPAVGLNTLEKAFRDHARKSQDDSVYSKWSSLKTKAESSADRFLTDVVSLIESISMMSQMQSTLQGQLPEPMSNSELPVAPKPIGEKRVR